MYSKTQDKQKEEDFDYYKRHILLENYDEEPENYGEIANKIERLKSSSEDGVVSGFTKWLGSDGKHFWKKCQVLSYDEEEKLINIVIINENDKVINKKVTRFNFRFEDEPTECIERRVRLAEKWKHYAKKYVAYYHFVSSFTIENIPELINQNFIDKILTLVFLYKGAYKPQLTPLQIEALDNSVRFGIWRRHARKRQIEVDKKKLLKILSSKKLSTKHIEIIFNEVKEYYERSLKMMEFYKKLPLNFDLFLLLSEIIPKEKFLISSERYLNPTNEKGTITEQFKRHKPFIPIYKKIEYKLHHSESDLGNLLLEMNKKIVEDLKDKLFFYKNWFIKPIKIKEFYSKNKDNIKTLFKEVNFLTGHANYEIINYMRERLKETKKVNKDTSIPASTIKKFRSFQDLLNRRMATFTREIFHKSMDYLTDTYRLINNSVISIAEISKDFNTLTIEEIVQIRDNYNLEDAFFKNFSLLQFSFELNYGNSLFTVEPSFDQWWQQVERLIKKKIFYNINNAQAINVYELLTKEEQDSYYINSEAKLTVFYEDDKSYEDDILTLQIEMKRYYSLVERLLFILNSDVKTHLSELLNFSKDIKNKNYDEDSLNIEVFRYFINLNKQYLNFFKETFKYDNFFLGGILINTKTTKEYWVNRLNDIMDLLIKLIIDNNVYLSKKMEGDKEAIEKKLEEEPQSVDEYKALMKYCEDLNEQLRVIWKKINSQQQNAELLEENFFILKREDFFRMWSCYGIPKYLHLKKQETLSRLGVDRKKFKKELKQRYFNTIQEISKIRNDYESSTVNTDIDNYEKYYNTFSDLNYRIERMIKQCSVLNDHQLIIGIKVTDLSEIKEIYNNFIDYYHLWEAVNNFESRKINWLNDPLKRIDRKLLKSTYDQCNNTLDRLEKSVFRRDKPAPNTIIQLLREKIKEFDPLLPILYDLINPDFKPNHINDLSKEIGVEIPDDLSINLKELIDRGVMNHIDEINERSTYATGQKKLAANLDKFKEKYKSLRFELTFYKDSDLLVFKDIEPILDDIDTLLTKVVSMSSSKFAKYLQKDIQTIWQNLSRAQEIIDVWLKVQKLIQQQQQIFVYGDLKKQLQEEYPKYEFVEKQWRGIMDQFRSSPLVSEINLIAKLKETLTKSLTTLEEINKSLIAYLNTKRDVFPRFYFISNEELTMMLAQSGDPTILSPLTIFNKHFEGILKD